MSEAFSSAELEELEQLLASSRDRMNNADDLLDIIGNDKLQGVDPGVTVAKVREILSDTLQESEAKERSR